MPSPGCECFHYSVILTNNPYTASFIFVADKGVQGYDDVDGSEFGEVPNSRAYLTELPFIGESAITSTYGCGGSIYSYVPTGAILRDKRDAIPFF